MSSKRCSSPSNRACNSMFHPFPRVLVKPPHIPLQRALADTLSLHPPKQSGESSGLFSTPYGDWPGKYANYFIFISFMLTFPSFREPKKRHTYYWTQIRSSPGCDGTKLPEKSGQWPGAHLGERQLCRVKSQFIMILCVIGWETVVGTRGRRCITMTGHSEFPTCTLLQQLDSVKTSHWQQEGPGLHFWVVFYIVKRYNNTTPQLG